MFSTVLVESLRRIVGCRSRRCVEPILMFRVPAAGVDQLASRSFVIVLILPSTH